MFEFTMELSESQGATTVLTFEIHIYSSHLEIERVSLMFLAKIKVDLTRP